MGDVYAIAGVNSSRLEHGMAQAWPRSDNGRSTLELFIRTGKLQSNFSIGICVQKQHEFGINSIFGLKNSSMETSITVIYANRGLNAEFVLFDSPLTAPRG